MTSSSASYYDIDAILAEEELIPCTTLFDFSHLAHLDPDGTHHHRRKQSSAAEENLDSSSKIKSASTIEYFLPENSRIKIPLWAVEKWAMLGFVRLQLPRHYGRRARERYEADPGEADLRKRNERFFLAGRMLVDLIERSAIEVAKSIRTKPRSRNARSLAQAQALVQVSEEARDLRRTLIKTYAGERLRKVFDWSQSSGGGDDDVSSYLSKLTEMEQRLYYTGSSAVAALEEWKLFGNRRLLMGPLAATPSSNKRSVVTPGEERDLAFQPPGQRRRFQ